MELFEIICNFLLFIAGFSAVGIYLFQKHDEKKSAATLVVMQIDSLKNKLPEITELISNNKINETGIYETLDILDDNQWNKYKHLFVGNIDITSLKIIDDFYYATSLIREQLVLAKKLQQQSFFNNQQMLANNFNYFLIQGLEKKYSNNSSDIKEAIAAIPIETETESKMKELAEKMLDNQIATKGDDNQFLNTYLYKTNEVKDLFGKQGIFIGYLPEQIRITIEKELKKISHIEVIGCSGYKKLKKIANIDQK